jgi:AcrR family transcriptional regulator
MQRQNADHRAKQLRLAILRIEKGRTQTGEMKLSVSAVAREVGVTPALIHNHYPEIAEEIRVKVGASSRAQRDAKQKQLNAIRDTNKALRGELAELRLQVARLASINETLLLENMSLRASAEGSTVSSFKSKKC